MIWNSAATKRNKEWLEYFDKLVPKKEMNELKNFSNKKATQVKQGASYEILSI